MSKEKPLLVNGTGCPHSDKLIADVRKKVGVEGVANRRVNNCIPGDVVGITNKLTGINLWGVVLMPQILFYFDGEKIVKTKLCDLKRAYKVAFWR